MSMTFIFFKVKPLSEFQEKKHLKIIPPIGVQFLFKALGLFYKTFAFVIFPCCCNLI